MEVHNARVHKFLHTVQYSTVGATGRHKVLASATQGQIFDVRVKTIYRYIFPPAYAQYA